MGFELLVGPPGSGKTHLLLERVTELATEGKRVWWAGLPAQRTSVYRRATARGALLGLEFQTLQQVYYRLLAHAQALKPLIRGTGRLALVGEALAHEQQGLPSPGEARLFAAAVAEAKRYGLEPSDLPGDDRETERLRNVYRAYERLKADAWDYDDFRLEALRLAECGRAAPEADALIVDGLRELSPLDMRLLSHLGRACEVHLALPRTPPGLEPDRVLGPRDDVQRSCYRAANPVSEARWVLNSLKRDLACGLDPLDLAVILPGGESVAFTALADEYGVPVMDERPEALADSRPGRLLIELLELPDYPTASRLLPIRELAPLADAALDEGVAGFEALDRLARRLGLGEAWEAWIARLKVPPEGGAEALDEWAGNLVDLALTLAGGGERGRYHPGTVPERFREQALLRAKEAQRVAAGDGFRAWWAALLGDSGTSSRKPGGVALIDERQASGRRFRKAYLMRANEGAYGAGEREDYFVPEELRLPLSNLLQGSSAVLPRRFEGRDELLFEELLTVADELVVTFPSGDQGGPLLPEPALIGEGEPEPLPPLPVASRLELAVGEGYRADRERSAREPAPTPAISLEELRRFDECAMRHWLEGLLERQGDRTTDRWWDSLRRDLLGRSKLDAERLAFLADRHPPAAAWLERHHELLLGLSFGVRLPVQDDRVYASLDAAVTSGSEARIYAFAPPGETAAQEFIEERWTELWAAGHMLARYPDRIKQVRLFVWPLLGEPVEAYSGGIRREWGRIAYRRERAEAALSRLDAGSIEPSPGFRCRSCVVRDACREAAR